MPLFTKASSHFAKASSHFAKASSHFAKALLLTGPLIGVFPHSTRGNSLRLRGVFTGQLPTRFFHLGGAGGEGLYSGPQHVPSPGHLK